MNPLPKALLAVCLLLVSFSPAVAAPPSASAPASANTASLKHEIQNAIDQGLAWLETNQTASGHWSNADHPALSALALVALQGDPSSTARKRERRLDVVRKGYDYLARCVRPDGGIYVDRKLVNYNTSISLMALLLAEDKKHQPVIQKARALIATKQQDLGERGKVDHKLDGGFGYGDGSAQADMVNTVHALEALHFSRARAADQGDTAARELHWDAAIQFIQNCQHLPGVNKQSWVSEDAQNRGGFIYAPGESKAPDISLPGGRTALRAYASISYAGMLSYVYAGLKPEDPRVVAVLDWIKKNYTFEENPGMGPQGLYFYFHTMAKALSAAGVGTLETADGKSRDWRSELALHLIQLQQAGGKWENANARWWEKDAVLSTSYALIALEIIHRGL